MYCDKCGAKLFKCPNWLPVPQKEYECFAIEDGVLYMASKPKLKHILRYKFIPVWWRKYKARAWIRDILEG